MSGKLIERAKLISAVAQGLEKGGWGVVNSMKSSAPKDTGYLRSEIKQELNGTTLKIFSNAEYSSALEYGTGIYNTKGSGRTTPWTYTPDGGMTFYTTVGQRPQPFFEHNFNQGKITIPSQIKSSLRKEYS